MYSEGFFAIDNNIRIFLLEMEAMEFKIVLLSFD